MNVVEDARGRVALHSDEVHVRLFHEGRPREIF